MADRLSTATSTAVRSLQFEDIVRQIAEHAEARLEQLVTILDVSSAEASNRRTDAPDERTELGAATQELLRNAPSRPAEQQDLATGEIELF